MIKGPRVLGYGINQLRYAKRFSYFEGSLHAEADLIRRHEEKVRGATVLVYRFNNAPKSDWAGQPLCGKPCPLCGHLLRQARVGRVWWFGHDGKPENLLGEGFSELTGDPVAITQRFVQQIKGNRDGKFQVKDYLAL